MAIKPDLFNNQKTNSVTKASQSKICVINSIERQKNCNHETNFKLILCSTTDHTLNSRKFFQCSFIFSTFLVFHCILMGSKRLFLLARVMEIHDLNIFHHGSFKLKHVHGIDKLLVVFT